MPKKNWDRVHNEDRIWRNRVRWDEVEASRKSYYAQLRAERESLKLQLESEIAAFRKEQVAGKGKARECEAIRHRLRLIDEELRE